MPDSGTANVRQVEGAPCFAFEAGLSSEDCAELSFIAVRSLGMWWYFCKRHGIAYTQRSLEQLVADVSDLAENEGEPGSRTMADGTKIAGDLGQTMACLSCGLAGTVPPSHFPLEPGLWDQPCPQCGADTVWITEVYDPATGPA